VPGLAYLEGAVRSVRGARLMLLLECPWVVLTLGVNRYRSAAELLESVRDPAVRFAPSSLTPLTCTDTAREEEGKTCSDLHEHDPSKNQLPPLPDCRGGSQDFFLTRSEFSAEEAPANDAGRG
jgi:hypothetical protein